MNNSLQKHWSQAGSAARGLILFLAIVNVAAWLTVAAVQETDPQKMWAFIVGVSNYTHAEPLSYASTDAQAFADFLRSPRGGGIPNDHIVALLEENASRTSIEYEMEQFWDKVLDGDTVFIYFAGHGFVHRRRIGYFLPVDGDPTSPNSTSIQMLALQQMISFGFAHARQRVMISDMCHSGVLAEQQNAINQLVLQQFGNGGGGAMLNLVASAQDEPSWEDSQLGHGIFTYTLLKALNGMGLPTEEKLLKSAQVVKYVQSEVPQLTAMQQNPLVNDDYDPSYPLAYLDRPGPMPVTPEEGTVLVLEGGGDQFIRAQWIDPHSEAITVRPIPEKAQQVAIGPLQPGELELTLFDTKNQRQIVKVNLKAGANQYDVTSTKVGYQLTPVASRSQVASLATTGLPLQTPPAAVATPAPLPEPSLLLKLEPDTDVYVNGAFFARSESDRPLQLQGIGREPLRLRLVYGTEREQRFRIKPVSGTQLFDPASHELIPLRQVAPPPSFLQPPADISPSEQENYQRFQQAIWEDRLIQPAGDSAWDYYFQMQPNVTAAQEADLRRQLVVAMGNSSQRIILKYLKGGDIKWTPEVFQRGADLISRLQQLFQESDYYRSQEQFFRGRSALERADYATAERLLQSSIQLDGEASHSYNAVGLSLWQQNRLQEALVPLERAIELTPYWNYPRITRALVLLEQRRYQESEAGFRDALANNPEESTAHHGLGQLYLLTRRWREAVDQVNRAIEFNPGNAYAHQTLGVLQMRLQQPAEAERNLRLAILLEPDEPAFHLTLADILQQMGRIPEAGSIYSDLNQRHPDNVDVLDAQGRFLSRYDPSRAAQVFSRALELEPDNSNLRVSYGIFLRGRQQIEPAEKEFQQALKSNPENAFAHYQLADLAFSKQQIQASEKAARRAIEADPRYSHPHRLLGQIAFSRREHDQALRHFRTARDLAIEAHQRQQIQELIDQIEATIVDQNMTQVDQLEERGNLNRAWQILSATLERAQESRPLRNRIIRFHWEHSSDAEVGKLPPSSLRDVLATRFWQSLRDAEDQWQRGQRGEAAGGVLRALETLDQATLEKVGSTAFNFENEEHGIHEKLYQWGTRLIESGRFEDALQLMERADELFLFKTVPGLSTITVDSLMRPADVTDPSRFEDFEVAHHPDHRAHELLAAGWAGRGEDVRALRYLEALEFSRPHLGARLLIAKAVSRAGRLADGISMLDLQLLENEAEDEKQLAEAWILRARLQCQLGDCPAGLATLERGLRRLPGNQLLKEARDDIR